MSPGTSLSPDNTGGDRVAFAANVQYLPWVFATTPEARYPRRNGLIVRALDDLDRLCDRAKEHS